MKPLSLVLDFETYYDAEYSLRRKGVTLTSYINDKRFKVHGAGLIIENKEPVWVTGSYIPYTFSRIPWERTIVIGHNLKFDASILHWKYGIKPAMLIDTKGMARALLGNIPNSFSLDELGNYLFGIGKLDGLEDTKGILNLPPDVEARLAAYCKRDCSITFALYNLLKKYFPREEYKHLDSTIRMFSEPVLELDKQRLLEYYKKVIADKAELLKALGNRYGADVFRSNDKFAALLRSMGVEPPIKVSKSDESKYTYAFAKTDEDFLALQEHDDPQVALAVQARLGIKTSIEETRSLSYAMHADYGAWPVDIEYCGALATHRYSGAKGGGGNPQNLTRKSEIRKSVKAKKKFVCLVVDSSAIELRTTMTLAGQQNIIELLRAGGDVYCNFASDLFGRPITKADELERFLGKLSCLSLQYGCGFVKFKNIAGLNKVKLTEEQSSDIVEAYRKIMYCIPRLWRILGNAIPAMRDGLNIEIPPSGIITTGYDPFFTEFKNERVPCLNIPGGLRLRYPGLRRDSNGQWVYMTRTHRTAHETKLYGGKLLENISQCLAGRIVNWQGSEYTRQSGYRCVMQVHDEVVSVIPEEEVDRCKPIITKCFSTPPPWWPEIPVSCEVKVNPIYGMAK